MNKKKLMSRILIFVIGLPAVLAIVFVPFCHHLLLHVAICVTSGIAAHELYRLFLPKVPLFPKPFLVVCTLFIPFTAAVYEVVLRGRVPFGQECITYAMLVVFLIVLFAEVLSATHFEHSTMRLAASLFIIIYAGYLITFLSRMTVWEAHVASNPDMDFSGISMVVFLLMVFLCDSFAWFFGMLFGKNNRGVVRASPNKSIAGFAGGFVGSLCAGLVGYYVLGFRLLGRPLFVLLAIGLCVAFAAIVGDLIESVFKRSAGVKDSGHIIPGRGGILDSIDSIVVAAPLYYLLISLCYGTVVSS